MSLYLLYLYKPNNFKLLKCSIKFRHEILLLIIIFIYNSNLNFCVKHKLKINNIIIMGGSLTKTRSL